MRNSKALQGFKSKEPKKSISAAQRKSFFITRFLVYSSLIKFCSEKIQRDLRKKREEVADYAALKKLFLQKRTVAQLRNLADIAMEVSGERIEN